MEITSEATWREVGQTTKTYRRKRTMTTTTSYGTWANLTGNSLTVGQWIADALNGHDGDIERDFDLPAIESEFRDALAEQLPKGVTLAGSEFYGPAFDRPDFSLADLRDKIEGTNGVTPIDFWAIVQRHDRTR